MHSLICLGLTNEFRNLPEQEKKQNMNVKKILILSVISLLVAFSSCNTLRKNNNYHWKKDEDYSLIYGKLRRGERALLKINVIEFDKILSKNNLSVRINGISTSERVEPLYYLDADKKYNIFIWGGTAAKSVYIRNIKVKERDSIVLTVHLKDTLWIE